MNRSFVLERKGKRPILIDWTVPVEDVKGVVLFSHGFKGYKDWGDWNTVASEFAHKGLVFVKFNFSCNGGTMNEPIDFPDLDAFGENSYWKEQIDLKEMIDWTVNKFNQKVHLIGHSRGGAAVLLQSGNEKVLTVTSWAGVSDFMSRLKKDEIEKWEKGETVFVLNGRTKQEMPMSSVFYDDLMIHRSDLDIESIVRSAQKRTLAIHCKDDLAVSYMDSLNLEKWNENTKAIILENGGHTFEMVHPGSNNLNSVMQQVIDQTISFVLEK